MSSFTNNAFSMALKSGRHARKLLHTAVEKGSRNELSEEEQEELGFQFHKYYLCEITGKIGKSLCQLTETSKKYRDEAIIELEKYVELTFGDNNCFSENDRGQAIIAQYMLVDLLCQNERQKEAIMHLRWQILGRIIWTAKTHSKIDWAMKMMATFWISKISKTCGSNRVCDVCLQTVEKIFVCQGCQHAKYCSKECQILDWKEKGHKKACKLMAKKKKKRKQKKKEKKIETGKNGFSDENDSCVPNRKRYGVGQVRDVCRAFGFMCNK